MTCPYNFDTKLKIGPSCIHMNISGVYEASNALYLALAYTNIDFIYNKKEFTNFLNAKNTEEYISKDNELIIVKDIDSIYLNDSKDYLNYCSNQIFNPFKYMKDLNYNITLKEMQSNYLSAGVPVMYSCDHYYTYDDYIKFTNEILKFHTNGHMAILCDIDMGKKIAYVVDKFYGFKGYVNLENLIRSINSTYLDAKMFSILDIKQMVNGNEKINFENNLDINFRLLLKDTEVVNGKEYFKNVGALELFYNDFEQIVESLYDTKGKYAPQFLSKLISNYILQRISFSNLLKYYNSKYPNKIYDKLIELTDNSKKLWNSIDIYNDKYYLSNICILDKIDKYSHLIESIIKNDIALYTTIKTFYGI